MTLPPFCTFYVQTCSLRKQKGTNTSCYLRPDIYVDGPLLHVGFVALQQGMQNTGEGGVFNSFPVNKNTEGTI